MDGYKQKNAFISMQGPLPRTFCDTWQMVWELRVVVIVMTTRTVERTRTKCGQYWPELEGENKQLTRGSSVIVAVFQARVYSVECTTWRRRISRTTKTSS